MSNFRSINRNQVRLAHQSMPHLVADAPWSDEAMLPAVAGIDPVVACSTMKVTNRSPWLRWPAPCRSGPGSV